MMARRLLSLLALLVLALLADIFSAQSLRAEPVRVSAAARDDFGRIVFNWNSPVSHKSSVSGGTMTVRFARPIEASFGRVTRTLRKYVKSVKSGGDGQSVVVELAGEFDVYSFDSGSSVIVEIAEKETAPKDKEDSKQAKSSAAKPNAEAKPAEKTAGAVESGKEDSDLPTVRVRTGQHAEYTRLVFDWPSKVAYDLKQDGAIATLTFNRAVNFNLKALTTGRVPFIGGARAGLGDGTSTVTLSVPKTSKLRHFLAGAKVVVDVRRPSGSQKAEALPPEQAPKKELEMVAEKAPETPKAPEVNEPASQPASKTADIKKTTESGAVKTAAQLKTGAEPAEPAKGPEPVSGQTPGTPTRLTPPPGTQAAASSPSTAPEKPQALQGSRSRAAGLPPLAPAPSGVRVAAAPPASGSSSGPGAAPADAVTLRFDWSEPVGAAIFRRGGTLWIAFDKPTAIDVAQLREAGRNIIKGVEQMGTTQGTVLRLATMEGINPSVRRDGLAWLLDFRKQPLDAKTPLTVHAQPNSPVGARLFVPVPEPGKPIGITDPEVGDNLIIVPLIPLSNGIGLEYVYPQLRFITSAQGIVVQPRVDDIRVRPLREGVEVTSGGELQISAVSEEAEANRKLAAMKPLTRILDLEPWKVKSPLSFRNRKHELLYAVSRSKGTAREATRLDLVRFYIANGYFAEGLAVLRESVRTRSGIEQNPEFRMLRGVAKFMLGRYVEADKDFFHDELKWIDEAAFWRGAIRAAIGDITAAASVLRRTGRIIRPYPKAIKIPLGQLVADTALKAGDIKQARYFLEFLRLDNLTPKEKNLLDYEEGRVLELSGDFDAAIAKWEAVRDGTHRPSQPKAVISRMELLRKLDRLPLSGAIQDLEKIRFAWRGDEFEFNLLRRLGTLYIENGQYRKGLDQLRQAATYFRTHPDAPQVTLQMSDAFTSLYLDDAADSLPPVMAIAIYDEFKELTPAGVQGDEMIRKLADRLVGVDLLDRALQLLTAQVRYRLQGEEKARVGAQLALVHILARQYDEAIKTLDETDSPGLPASLVQQRLHIRARTLMGVEQNETALAVLKGDKSRDAELLRTEIFWGERKWSNAAQALRNLIRLTDAKPGKELDDRQAAYVLNYAIALTLSGNERALGRARSDFSTGMAKNRLKNAFNLIVSQRSLGLLDPGQVRSNVKEAENFVTFMAAYRERLKKENLSELVPPAARPKRAGRNPGLQKGKQTPEAPKTTPPAGDNAVPGQQPSRTPPQA